MRLPTGRMEMTPSVETGQEGTVVKLLWTGGWDSTFRLLSLITNHACVVQPYYLALPELPSREIEIETIDRIRGRCAANDQRCKGEILPPIIVDRTALAMDAETEAKHQALRAIAPLGGQYAWLARMAEECGIDDLELCVHRDDVAHAVLFGHVIEKSGFPTRTYVLDPDTNGDLTLFRGFEFPLFDVTKREMEQVARQQGFSEIMEMTWFCHRPVNGIHPCGTCNPCRFTIEEGMARRIGWRGRLRHAVHRLWERMPEGARRALKPYVDRAWPTPRA